MLLYNESLIETKNEEIEELEARLVRIMTSASSSAETRLEAINTMGQKSQTYRTVMDLIDDNLRTTSSALHEIEKLVKSNTNQNKIEQTDSKDIQNYCRTIKKGLQTVQEEMSGARNFVHPDRDMVQSLQQQILEQNKHSNSDDTNKNMIINNDEQTHNNTRYTEEDDNFDETFKAMQFQNNSKTSTYNRRQKSVHEIAWSKFNAGQETKMEDLQKKEREVLEQEIRDEILAKVQSQYDDKFDKKLAEMNAELQQKIREEIRMEYEDLEATISASTYNNEHTLN